MLFRGPWRRHESQAKLRWQQAWCGRPADRAWELGIRWFSADGGAKQGVCRWYSGFLFMDHHRPADKRLYSLDLSVMVHTRFADAEIWLILMFMLKYCERKTLFYGWKVVLNKLKWTGRRCFSITTNQRTIFFSLVLQTLQLICVSTCSCRIIMLRHGKFPNASAPRTNEISGS